MRPLSALIRTANAISGQITSFRLVMTELWTLTEVITGKSGCGKKKKKEKKREKKGKGQQGWEGMEEEEDRGWWNWVAVNFNLESKMGFFSCLQSCSSPKLTAMPDIQTSRCDPDRGVGLEGGLAPSVNFFLKSLQTSVIHFRPHTQKKKKNLMQEVRGSCSALWQRQRRMCDRGRSYRSWQHFSSVWNEEMDRQTKRRKEDTCLKLDRCQNLKGSRTVGRIWATDKSKLTHIEALKKKKSTFSKLFRAELYLIISSNM